MVRKWLGTLWFYSGKRGPYVSFADLWSRSVLYSTVQVLAADVKLGPQKYPSKTTCYYIFGPVRMIDND